MLLSDIESNQIKLSQKTMGTSYQSYSKNSMKQLTS